MGVAVRGVAVGVATRAWPWGVAVRGAQTPLRFWFWAGSSTILKMLVRFWLTDSCSRPLRCCHLLPARAVWPRTFRLSVSYA